MATWKEKGIVPDSDDEDDLESQSVRHSQHNKEEDAVHNYDRTVHDNDLEGSGGVAASIGNRSSAEAVSDREPTEPGTPGQKPRSAEPLSTAKLHSSPPVPRSFQIPELFWEDSQHDDQGGARPSFVGSVTDGEGVSRSYVRITSPSSSILSSPPSSRSPPLSRLVHGESAIANVTNGGLTSSQTQGSASRNDLSTSQEEQGYRPKRALRHRNLIQLHPYVVEQEKYRQTLKARGIAPMRLAPSQDITSSRSQESVLPEHDTPEHDSQTIAGDMYDTQEVEDEYSLLASSPLTKLNRGRSGTDNVANTGVPIEEDDEFPNIENLLKLQQGNACKARLIRVPKSYSKKIGRRTQSHVSTASTMNIQHTVLKQLQDTPPSPPISSPPIVAPRGYHRPSSTNGYDAMEDSMEMMVDEDGDVLRVSDLPTPITSSTKAIPDPVSLDSSTESLDPFASSSSSQSSVESLSDDSHQLRKIGKKIRGVLPASHLRLNGRNVKSKVRVEQENLSVSPIRSSARKGVALPRDYTTPRTSSIGGLLPFSDESEEDNDGAGGFVQAKIQSLSLNTTFDETRLGIAEEDNGIDAMLPAGKRRSSNIPRRYKKRKLNSIGKKRHQSTITEHMKRSGENSTPSITMPRKQKSKSGNHVRRPRSTRAKTRRPTPPMLSILDVMGPSSRERTEVPQFLRIAARTASLRTGQGRQSPTKKFIRLATREDTYDAQSVLEDWKSGQILARNITRLPMLAHQVSRTAVGPVDDNYQTRFHSPISKLKPRSVLGDVSALGVQRLVISARSKQQSIERFVTQEEKPRSTEALYSVRPVRETMQRHPPRVSRGQQKSRPAQLESAGTTYPLSHTTAAFKTRKRILDTLYRVAPRRPPTDPKVQLSRFLADGNDVRPSIETCHNSADRTPDHPLSNGAIHSIQHNMRTRKRLPKRIDAGAAKYRQPSHPLILHSTIDEPSLGNVVDGNKLLGLGKFGTKYSINFDVLPLQQGIFFHESTILGSGLLQDIVHRDVKDRPAVPALGALKFGENEFVWTSWDERTSSEIGVCFDWILEQFLAKASSSTCDRSSTSVVEVVKYVMIYIHSHLSFDGVLDKQNFLSRMIPIIRELSTRLPSNEALDHPQIQSAVEVLSNCAILVLPLLFMARAQWGNCDQVYEVEELFRLVTSRCASLLLAENLVSVRKLYDDLQYLSFRATGIKSDQYNVVAWVTLIHVVGAARIPRCSFWDITNSQLAVNNISNLDDAPAMENLWYTLYMLLPLCEFNELGVLVPGLRQTVSFENWTLPQQMIKRLSSFYKANQRQSAGFNEYCRSIFARCHYLMVEWGWWKCSSIVGIMFDFFASQNLSHLRNEEVYHSPRFLEILDTEPSLAIEPEDRCFHIFLKVAALAIQHLRGQNDAKAIRNLVARITPNHDRQYPKEEAVHQRDLASLRNHHDLLSTLFWITPPDQRPLISLVQELVVPERSHKEACLINLRAWENLARFVATSTSCFNAYRSFIHWQNSFFNAVHEQYLCADSEVRQQAEALHTQSGELMTEAQIVNTVLSNRRSLIVSMCRSINAMTNVVKIARSDTMVKQIINGDMISKALDPIIHKDEQLSNTLLQEVLLFLCAYMDQTNHLSTLTHSVPLQGTTTNEDSQDSLDIAEANWGRLELVLPLENIVQGLSPVLRKRLEASSEFDNQYIIVLAVGSWAGLISLLTEDEPKKLQPFLSYGKNALFENRSMYQLAREVWPLFLAKLLEHNISMSDFPADFSVGLQWLLSLTNPRPISAPQRQLTSQLHHKGYFLCAAPKLHEADRIYIVRSAIKQMSTLLLDNTTERTVGLVHKAAQRLFSDMLGELMRAIQQVLESLETDSETHRTYLKFAQAVITDIKCFASDFRPLTEFFVHPSASYWPHDTDPNLYAAGIIAYCIRLGHQPERTSFELFYYLHGGWKNALISSRMQNYSSHLKKGMKCLEFTQFMLLEFIPSVLRAGFSAGGWLLCQTFLPAISHQVGRRLAKVDENTVWVFKHIINVLKIMINGITSLLQRFGHGIGGFHPDHREMLTVAFQFWFSLAPHLRQYVERYPTDLPVLEEVSDPLSNIIYSLVSVLETSDFDPYYTFPDGELDIMKGKFTDTFTAAIIQDIQDHWQFVAEDGSAVVVGNRSKEQSAPQMLSQNLREILNCGVVGYIALFDNKERVQLPERRDNMIMGLFC